MLIKKKDTSMYDKISLVEGQCSVKEKEYLEKSKQYDYYGNMSTCIIIKEEVN